MKFIIKLLVYNNMYCSNIRPRYNQTYTKNNVDNHEFNMQLRAQSLLENVPKIITYDPEQRVMVMEKIPQMNIADMYGEDVTEIDPYIWESINNSVRILHTNGIEYSDITGYNFIEYDGLIWMIDFGHAQNIEDIIKNKKKQSQFVIDFMNGSYDWNPDFK